MTRTLFVLLGLSLVGLCTLSNLGRAQKSDAAKHGWLTNLKQAKQLAQQTGKPLFVVFRCEP